MFLPRRSQRGYAATKKRDGSFTTKVAKYTKSKGKSIIIISKFFVAFVRFVVRGYYFIVSTACDHSDRRFAQTAKILNFSSTKDTKNGQPD